LQTFIRQKVLSSGLPNTESEKASPFATGALLYALHMRLLCPPSKVRARKSWPRSKQDNDLEIKQSNETGLEQVRIRTDCQHVAELYVE
jgi:hypothetical protein